MPCVATDVRTELEFVQALEVRGQAEGQCSGPLLQLSFFSTYVMRLERILESQIACDVLWQGFVRDYPNGPEFSLCAAHWFDLATLAWARGVQHDQAHWLIDAEHLLLQLCRNAHWDPKELANMFVWQRARLT